MAHASQTELESAKKAMLQANKYLLPRLTKCQQALSSFAGKSLIIFYPGCGYMPGLDALITSLTQVNKIRNFKVICVDIEDYSANILAFYEKNLKETCIHEFSFSNGANAQVSFRREDATVSREQKVNVNVEYNVQSVLQFLSSYKGNKMDLIFLENPAIEAATLLTDLFSPLNRPTFSYRASFGLLANITKSSGTQVVVATHTRLELLQAKYLLEICFSNKNFSSQTTDLLALVLPIRPYRNFLLCEAHPHTGSEHQKKAIAAKNTNQIMNADSTYHLWLVVSFILSFKSKPFSFQNLLANNANPNEWFSFATLLLTIGHIPSHRVGRKGMAIHAGLLLAQGLCWYAQHLTGLESDLTSNEKNI